MVLSSVLEKQHDLICRIQVTWLYSLQGRPVQCNPHNRTQCVTSSPVVYGTRDVQHDVDYSDQKVAQLRMNMQLSKMDRRGVPLK